MRLGHVS